MKIKKIPRIIKQDDIHFVVENARSRSDAEMAEKSGLARWQVARILVDIKAQLRKCAGEKVEPFIQTYLVRQDTTAQSQK